MKLKNKAKLNIILTNKNIVKSINTNLDFILDIMPEIKDIIDFPHNNPHHHLDVWTHTLLALSLSENDFEMRLCLLLHDIGKPRSYQDEEIRHFKGHALKSSEISRNILNRLGYDKNYIEEICYLIENHDTPITKEDILNNYDLEYMRYKIQYCDILAHNPRNLKNRLVYLRDTLKLIKSIESNSKQNKYNIVKNK